MDRRDWIVWMLHIIKRRYKDTPHYGWLLWGGRRIGGWTFDVWVGRTLWTFRRANR